ncbi:hypothetical protein O1611_g10524 [Lasiodiplodia mahajangana]|uniref:Uncharacterized protein n=1 Tax=Lasiodiplodia mahajangana TaxID=1108764 RepID=A0ACC2IXA3_9PEZI|nr:hypothetical protein O1611_g10524 [Lasiodiplodia mahajangana]
MSPVFPRREDVEMPLRAALDEIIVGELSTYRHFITEEEARDDTAVEPTMQQGTTHPPHILNREDPWVQQQWKRLPDFHPAVLVLGWR